AQFGELRVDERDRLGDPRAVGTVIQPAARAGGVREGNRGGVAVLEAAADALGDAFQAQQSSCCDSAHGHDQARADESQLPVAPECAELLLAGCGRAVASTGRRLPGVAARDGCAVEGGVERVLVELEPAAQRPAGAAAPRPALNA